MSRRARHKRLAEAFGRPGEVEQVSGMDIRSDLQEANVKGERINARTAHLHKYLDRCIHPTVQASAVDLRFLVRVLRICGTCASAFGVPARRGDSIGRGAAS
jgi:hypothetical protein